MTFAEQMAALLDARVKRSLERIAAGPPPFPREAEDLAESSGEPLKHLFRHHTLTPDPVLYLPSSHSTSDYSCLQEDFFGFYLLRETLRWPLSAVNFQLAGTATLAQELYAPATALFYTAAYHSLHAFLALNGRAILDHQTFHWIDRPDKCPNAIAACLTRRGQWVFEGRDRTHVTKWRELNSILGRRGYIIPSYFHKLFRHLFSWLTKPGWSTLDVIRDPERSRAALEDNLERFLQRIPDVRNIALYQGKGADPHVVDALLNRDQFDKLGIEGQAKAIGLFSQSLLADSAAMARRLLDLPPSLRPAHRLILILGARFPWADEPRLDKWEDTDLRQNLECLWSWVHNLPDDAGEDLAAVGD